MYARTKAPSASSSVIWRCGPLLPTQEDFGCTRIRDRALPQSTFDVGIAWGRAVTTRCASSTPTAGHEEVRAGVGHASIVAQTLIEFDDRPTELSAALRGK